MGRRTPGRRWMMVLTVIGLAGVVLWVVRGGDSEVERLRAELRARGEKLTVEELTLAPVQTNEAARAILEAAQPVFETMSRAEVVGVTYEEERFEPPQVTWRQEVLYSPTRRVLDWDKAAAVVDVSSADLAALHEVMKDPPSAGWEAEQIGSGRIINYAPLRVAAQGLHERTMVELHRGEVDAAFTNLLSLVRLVRYHRDCRTFGWQMLRVAITRLTADAVWHASQAEGWSEPQLQALQWELQSTDLLAAMPEAMEVERVSYLLDLGRIRKRGLEYVEQLSQRYRAASVSRWKQWVYYTHWRSFRGARAEMRAMREFQLEIDVFRELKAGRPLNELTVRPMRAPTQPRLHRWLDDWINPSGGFTILTSFSGMLNATRAPHAAVRSESGRRMAVTALALMRFRLNRGELPERLDALVPEYLPSVPVDPYDGRPLRFEPLPSGQFRLVAVGLDGNEEYFGNDDPYWPVAEDPEPGSALAELPSPASRAEILPLVYFQDAPVVDVIKTLARQAGIHIIFEPGVTEAKFPPISVRLENVTAEAVLEAVLKNNRLRCRLDPRSRITLISR